MKITAENYSKYYFLGSDLTATIRRLETHKKVLDSLNGNELVAMRLYKKNDGPDGGYYMGEIPKELLSVIRMHMENRIRHEENAIEAIRKQLL